MSTEKSSNQTHDTQDSRLTIREMRTRLNICMGYVLPLFVYMAWTSTVGQIDIEEIGHAATHHRIKTGMALATMAAAGTLMFFCMWALRKTGGTVQGPRNRFPEMIPHMFHRAVSANRVGVRA